MKHCIRYHDMYPVLLVSWLQGIVRSNKIFFSNEAFV